ncbi:MAG: winged helix-turn-helix domain-containing protein [Candidatus Nitrosopolaris sp.]
MNVTDKQAELLTSPKPTRDSFSDEGRYHEVHIYRLLHKWGFSPKVPRKRFVNTASNKEKKQFKKRLSK